MPSLDPPAYRWLRDKVFTRWRYLGIVDRDGHELCRLDTQTDSRCARAVDHGAGTVEFVCQIMGSDPEFVDRLPVHIGATVLYETDTGLDGISRVSNQSKVIAAVTEGQVLTHREHIPVIYITEAI